MKYQENKFLPRIIHENRRGAHFAKTGDKPFVLPFQEISIKDVELVGGKNASLGEMFCNLSKQGVSVPDGFAITASAYWYFLNKTGLLQKMRKEMKDIDITNVKMLASVGKKVRELILNSEMPKEIEKEIIQAYKELSKKLKAANLSVAVRSSATAEDLPDASFAGQQETYLNVKGVHDLLVAVKKCIASLFTNRAISYRETKGFDHFSVALSVTVQQMVNADAGSSGVMFTLDTESGFQGVVLINSSYGLGEYVVKGRVTPDQFFVFKHGLDAGKDAVISRVLGTKETKLISGNQKGTKQASVSAKDRNKFSITQKDAVNLSKWAVIIENYYHCPQDIEWVKESGTGNLYIVQARPETVKARHNHSKIEKYLLKKKGKEILRGISIGQKIGAGGVRVIENPADMKYFKKGEILVTRITDPDWEPIMRIASAIITEQGGKTSHAAIVSRELGVPCIVGAEQARKVLKTGKKITASCAEGEEGIIYDGILPFEVKQIDLKDIPQTKTKIMMNVGDPENAFSLSFLPHDGIGLAREEFIFSNFIRIHPLALIHFNKLKDKKAKTKILELTRGYRNKTDYIVDKLAEGVGRIAASVHPHDVIIRLSDFKTNEYATLIGGKEFEPKEENPMLGWRGASRYYSKEFEQAFGLECKAIKKAREDWGLKNIIVMVPFCRTPEEGEKVLAVMEKYGLKRGENGLQVYVMCEIPSNVILAGEFAKIFDGFSIGSNDLTQLALGVDRDSSLVSHVYNEKNKAVTDLIKNVIQIAHKHKRKVGICGQAPSDYPEFAEFLVRAGIDSISLNPDTLVETKKRIAYAEKTLGKKGRRTSAKFLSIVAIIGALAVGFVALGAGCSQVTGPQITDSGVSPAMLREKLEQKITEAKTQEFNKRMNTLDITSFANFKMKYPSKWNVQNWNGGVSVTDSETGEYFSVFKQLIKHPVAQDKKVEMTISGHKAYKFEDQIESDKSSFVVVEILMEQGKILEINAKTEKFEDMLASFEFTELSEVSNRPLTHWDIQEKRLCVQMITYAKQGKLGQCVAYPTPCDVPDDWVVCD
jgi:pyruvate,water dikinase